MRYLILLARGLRIIMLICRLGWMLVTVGLIVRVMSGQECDLFGRLGNGILPKREQKNHHLEERKIVEACRHEAATAMAMPVE